MLGVVPILAGVWTALPPEVRSSHNLPYSWVLAFLAALAVTLGQVIYQLRAPQIVRRSTLDDYMGNARREFRDQPTPDRIEAADPTLDPENPKMSLARLKSFYPPSERLCEFEQVVLKLINSQDKANPEWRKDAYKSMRVILSSPKKTTSGRSSGNT
jgi:hypothetical protein